MDADHLGELHVVSVYGTKRDEQKITSAHGMSYRSNVSLTLVKGQAVEAFWKAKPGFSVDGMLNCSFRITPGENGAYFLEDITNERDDSDLRTGNERPGSDDLSDSGDPVGSASSEEGAEAQPGVHSEELAAHDRAADGPALQGEGLRRHDSRADLPPTASLRSPRRLIFRDAFILGWDSHREPLAGETRDIAEARAWEEYLEILNIKEAGNGSTGTDGAS